MDPLLNLLVKLPNQYEVISSPFVKQRLRLLEVGGVKALGEPAVDRGEELARFAALALLLPQAAQADRRA
jgi:hypothetical protein